MGPPLQMAELAAILATVLAVVAAVPQLRRVGVDGDGHGVSLSAAALGVVNESVWIGYATSERLWSAVPEAVLMASANVLLAVWLLRAGAAGRRRAAAAAAVWAGVLAVVGAAGAEALAVVLGAAYAVQVAPAVWTAWRTGSPTGVATATWVVVLVESGLWGCYGVHHGDPATMTLGVVGVVAGSVIVSRKVVVRRRRTRWVVMPSLP